MKPFLGMDLTEDHNNTIPDGKEFLVQELSAATANALQSSTETAAALEEKSDVSKGWRIARMVLGCIAGLAILSLVKSVVQAPDMSIAQKYANAPWLFWGGGISLVAWMILKIWGDKKRETVSASEEGVAATEALENISQNALAELQVPNTAVAVDILAFYYKRKDGEIKYTERPMQLFSHINIPYWAFADADNLYFADTNGKYAFPRTSLKSIQTVKKKARLSQWNKADAFHSETYKAYRMTADQFGSVHTKPYYILEIQNGEETWGLYFPCYELPQIEALTGLRAE